MPRAGENSATLPCGVLNALHQLVVRVHFLNPLSHQSTQPFVARIAAHKCPDLIPSSNGPHLAQRKLLRRFHPQSMRLQSRLICSRDSLTHRAFFTFCPPASRTLFSIHSPSPYHPNTLLPGGNCLPTAYPWSYAVYLARLAQITRRCTTPPIQR